MLEFGATRIIN